MPSARSSSKAVVVLIALALVLVAVQLPFTAVGTTTGARWSEPATVATTTGSITSLATAGSGDDAVVAWIDRADDRWRVRVANVSIEDGSATVESPRTITSSSTELEGVDVAVDGSRRAIVWKIHNSNRVRLHTAGDTRTISSALRTRSPSVAFVSGTPVAAWIAYRNASFDLRVTNGRAKRWITADPGGVGSPTVVGGPNGGHVVWREGSNWTAETVPLGVDGTGAVTVGKRRPLGEAYAAGGFGTSVAGAIDAAGSNDGLRAVWTNHRVVTTAALSGGENTTPVEFGAGQRPRVAARNGEWVAAWLVETNSRGYDVLYRASDGSSGSAISLPGNSIYTSPVFGPKPGVVWAENTGGHTDILASAYRPDGTANPVERLVSSPERFGFVALASAVVGAVTLPMMPWVDASFIVAFLLTTRIASDLLLGIASRAAGATRAELRQRATGLPSSVWLAVFCLVEATLLALALPGMHIVSFSHPFAASGVAILFVAFVRYWLPGSFSGIWKSAALFTYVQTAILWVTVLPGYL